MAQTVRGISLCPAVIQHVHPPGQEATDTALISVGAASMKDRREQDEEKKIGVKDKPLHTTELGYKDDITLTGTFWHIDCNAGTYSTVNSQPMRLRRNSPAGPLYITWTAQPDIYPEMQQTPTADIEYLPDLTCCAMEIELHRSHIDRSKMVCSRKDCPSLGKMVWGGQLFLTFKHQGHDAQNFVMHLPCYELVWQKARKAAKTSEQQQIVMNQHLARHVKGKIGFGSQDLGVIKLWCCCHKPDTQGYHEADEQTFVNFENQSGLKRAWLACRTLSECLHQRGISETDLTST